MMPAKDCKPFCLCDRDWIFRHTKYTPDGKYPIGGKIVCYTCGRNALFDVSFMDAPRVMWKHESFGNGVWPIPDDVWAELEKQHPKT